MPNSSRLVTTAQYCAYFTNETDIRIIQTRAEENGRSEAPVKKQEFIGRVKGCRTLYLELGAGMNTPGIVKFSFWRMTAANPQAVYACINYGEACAPREIADRSICINGDIGEVLKRKNA